MLFKCCSVVRLYLIISAFSYKHDHNSGFDAKVIHVKTVYVYPNTGTILHVRFRKTNELFPASGRYELIVEADDNTSNARIIIFTTFLVYQRNIPLFN